MHPLCGIPALGEHLEEDASGRRPLGIRAGRVRRNLDNFARAFFAAQILGVQPRTHDLVFKGVFIDKAIKTGTVDEIADMYAKFGVDRAKFLSTMKSFGVTAKLNRAKQFALRTGITATPTIIVNGKYRVNVTTEGGFPVMLSTVTYLIGQERAAAAKAKPAPPKPAPAPVKKS